MDKPVDLSGETAAQGNGRTQHAENTPMASKTPVHLFF